MLKRAVVAGHICLDIIPQIDHPISLVPGRLYEVGAPTIATGGAVSNTGMTMHILGQPVTLMGKIGDDSFGKSVLEVVRARAPELLSGMAQISSVATSYTVVLNIPGTDRIFLHCPGANASYSSADVKWPLVAKAHLFHFGYPAFMAAMYADDARELLAMYARVKELGVTSSLDPGMPDAASPAGQVDWQRVLQRLLPNVDVFMPSADELLFMLGSSRFGHGDELSGSELAALGAQLLAMGAGVVAIKLGKRGMYVRSAGQERLAAMGAGQPDDLAAWADRELWFPIFQEGCFCGATGAGDASIAAFLSAMLRGRSLSEAGTFAAAVGACNVEAPDSLSGIQSWDATMARIAAGWEKVPLPALDQGWAVDAAGIGHGPADRRG
jgi:sugar/nucleoside kinase (ribokinase family)